VGLEDEIQGYRAGCQPYLLTLRMIARSEAGMAQSVRVVAEITEATGAILAGAEAADDAARAAAEVHRGITVAGMFLRVRLDRLAAAAVDAIAAAQVEDFAQMRHHLRRFEALTSAMWTVQDEVYRPRPARHRVPRRMTA
jgi:hypothetical protein